MIGQHYFMWCPDGCEGITGWQTRAKSPAITPEVEHVIKRYCMRYELPSSLKHLAAKTGELSAAEWGSAPVAIHYYPIGKGQAGLTRICLAPKPGDRSGNFFAHTLTFPRDALSAFDFNPFALSRSPLLRTDPGGAGKTLEELSEFPKAAGPRAGATPEWLERCSKVDQKLLRDLVACLSAPEDVRRPIILCLPKGRDAAPVIEAALLLLPATFRTSVCFDSYETDPYRVLGVAEGAEAPVAQMIGTIAPEEGGTFQFGPDSYRVRYYVFNVGEKKQSDTPEAGPYARHVCDAVSASNVGAVERAQALIELLRLGPATELWGDVLPAAGLMRVDAPVPVGEWSRAAAALTAACEPVERARIGLDLLWKKSWPELSRLPTSVAAEVAQACMGLLEKAHCQDEFRQRAKPEMVQAFSSTLLARRYASASQILAFARAVGGDAMPQVLLDGIVAAQDKEWPRVAPPASGDPAERAAYLEILAEGLREATRRPPKPATVRDLILLGFGAAAEGGAFKEAWEKLGGWLLDEGLAALPREQAEGAVDGLRQLLQEQGLPDGELEVLCWRLHHAPPAAQERPALLERIAGLCRRCREPERRASEILADVRPLAGEEDMARFYIALFASGQDQVSLVAAEDYRSFLAQGSDEAAQWAIRKRVAACKGVALLRCDCSTAIFPWRDEASPAQLRGWARKIFSAFPDVAREAVADLCQMAEQEEDRHASIAHLLTFQVELRDADLKEKGPANLVARSLVRKLPLIPPDGRQIASVVEGVDTDSWDQAARGRIEVAARLQGQKLLPGIPGPPRPVLGEVDRVLAQLLPTLDPDGWAEASAWLLSGLTDIYLKNRRTVEAGLELVLAPVTGEGRWTSDRSAQAPDLVAERIRSELFSKPYRKDQGLRFNALFEFACAARDLGPRLGGGSAWRDRHPAENGGQLSFEQAVARVVGLVLAADAYSTQRLLWAHLVTCLKDEEWVGQFRTEAIAHMREWRRRNGIVRRLWRRLFGSHGPKTPDRPPLDEGVAADEVARRSESRSAQRRRSK